MVQSACDAGTCSYCGAPLTRGYYFCLNCATPYQTVESVLPAVYVAPPSEDELIRRRAPHAWPLFWTYFGVVVAVAFICYFAFGPEQCVWGTIFASVALFVTTCVFAGIHWASLAVQFKQLGFMHPAAWLGLAALVPLLAVNYGYHEVFLRSLGVGGLDTIAEMRESLGRGGVVFLVCLMPAVVEEIAFRGLLQHWLQIAITPMRAVLLASALFTVMHFSILSAPYLFGVGVVLGIVKWKTGSLYPSMLIHFLHNLAVVELFQII